MNDIFMSKIFETPSEIYFILWTSSGILIYLLFRILNKFGGPFGDLYSGAHFGRFYIPEF